VRIHLAAKHPLEFELANALLERGRIALDLQRGGLIVLAFRQLQQLRGIADRSAGAVELRQLDFEFGALAPQLLGTLGRIPDGGIFKLEPDFF
jgi:hypothetical protein